MRFLRLIGDAVLFVVAVVIAFFLVLTCTHVVHLMDDVWEEGFDGPAR